MVLPVNLLAYSVLTPLSDEGDAALRLPLSLTYCRGNGALALMALHL